MSIHEIYLCTSKKSDSPSFKLGDIIDLVNTTNVIIDGVPATLSPGKWTSERYATEDGKEYIKIFRIF